MLRELEKLLKIWVTNFYSLSPDNVLLDIKSLGWLVWTLSFSPHLCLSWWWCVPKKGNRFQQQNFASLIFLCSGRIALLWPCLRVCAVGTGEWELAQRPASHSSWLRSLSQHAGLSAHSGLVKPAAGEASEMSWRDDWEASHPPTATGSYWLKSVW